MEHKIIYFGYPIDLVDDRLKQAGVIDRIQRALIQIPNVVVFRPARAYAADYASPRIQDINNNAMRECDAVVLYLNAATPTVGVPAEALLAAHVHNQPVILVADGFKFLADGDGVLTNSVMLNWLDTLPNVCILENTGIDDVACSIQEVLESNFV